MLSLYRNEGNGLFIDDAPTSSLGRESLLTLTFACFFFDVDNDGLLDIFTANGHVADDINRVQPKVTHAQPAHLFRNTGKARFQDVARGIPALAQPVVGRGAAHVDIDNDGDQDLVVTANNGPARVLRNDSKGGRALRLSLVGVKSNRSAIGASVRVTVGGVHPHGDGEDGLELPVAERTAAHLRARRSVKGGAGRDSLAQRPGGSARSAGRRPDAGRHRSEGHHESHPVRR